MEIVFNAAKLRSIEIYRNYVADHLQVVGFQPDFREKYLSCYCLLIDQISLPGCLYFVGC